MSALNEAADEIIEEFRKKVIAYKARNSMTYEDCSAEFEVGREQVRLFLNGSSPASKTLIKIKLATGIEL